MGLGTVAKTRTRSFLSRIDGLIPWNISPSKCRRAQSSPSTTMCAPRWLQGGYNVCPVTRELKRFWQSAGCARLLLQAARPREFTFATLSQDWIAVPRHLYELQPAAAPQVAGATQMSTRRPGCRFYFPRKSQMTARFKKKKKLEGREKSIHSNKIGFKWIFHVFTWESNHNGGSLYICWTYYNDSNSLNPVFLTELRMGWLLIFHYNGNWNTFTFECDGVQLLICRQRRGTGTTLVYLFMFYLSIYLFMFLVVLFWIKISP